MTHRGAALLCLYTADNPCEGPVVASLMTMMTDYLAVHALAAACQNLSPNPEPYTGPMVFASILYAKLLAIPLVVSYHTHIPEYIPRYVSRPQLSICTIFL